jgi:hypothetical protein
MSWIESVPLRECGSGLNAQNGFSFDVIELDENVLSPWYVKYH